MSCEVENDCVSCDRCVNCGRGDYLIYYCDTCKDSESIGNPIYSIDDEEICFSCLMERLEKDGSIVQEDEYATYDGKKFFFDDDLEDYIKKMYEEFKVENGE